MLVLGDVASVSWSLDLFEKGTVTTGDSYGTYSASSLMTDLDVGQVNEKRTAALLAMFFILCVRVNLLWPVVPPSSSRSGAPSL